MNDLGFVTETTQSSPEDWSVQGPSNPRGFPVYTKKTEIGNYFTPSSDENTQQRCPVHGSYHSLNQCRGFRAMSLSERKRFLRTNNICYKCCESSSHIFKDCKASMKCTECGSERHPTALHCNITDINDPTHSTTLSCNKKYILNQVKMTKLNARKRQRMHFRTSSTLELPGGMGPWTLAGQLRLLLLLKQISSRFTRTLYFK